MSGKISSEKKSTAMVLACLGFLGFAGVHRFYVGKIGSGILWLLTAGWFLVGTIVDLVYLSKGKFEDKNGNLLKK